MIEETLVSMVDRFNSHVQKNPAVGQELKDVSRTIELCITDGSTYYLLLKDSHIAIPGEGNGKKPDVKITTDTATFEALIKKELGPMKALVTRKLVIDASFEDKLLLRRLL